MYYGTIKDTINDLKRLYNFLQKALANAPDKYPYRGPKNFEEDTLKYTNSWEGEIESFEGKEIIYEKGNEVYGARYLGGLVDGRKE